MAREKHIFLDDILQEAKDLKRQHALTWKQVAQALKLNVNSLKVALTKIKPVEEKQVQTKMAFTDVVLNEAKELKEQHRLTWAQVAQALERNENSLKVTLTRRKSPKEKRA